MHPFLLSKSGVVFTVRLLAGFTMKVPLSWVSLSSQASSLLTLEWLLLLTHRSMCRL